MTALPAQFLPEYTYNDYIQWEGRWELIYGIPYAMAPAPGMYHQELSIAISSQFFINLKRCKSCKVYETIDWKISDETVLQPDILIVCMPFEVGTYLSKTPSLVVEILSPSTNKKDLNLKFNIYEKEGVKYYVIINPVSKKATIYELTEGSYKLIEELQTGKFDFDLNACKVPFDFGTIW